MPDAKWNGNGSELPDNFTHHLGVVQNQPALDRQRDPSTQLWNHRLTCLRFLLAVRDEKDTVQVLRVMEFGLKAEVDYYFLQPGSRVRVIGELISEKYIDHKTKTPRSTVTIDAAEILFEGNCTVERGLRRWREIEQDERENGNSDDLPQIARKLLKGFGE